MQDPRFYYLANFHKVLAWIAERYDDLLDAQERAFIFGFRDLEQASQALLVRMIMRKGRHFRASKLDYEEIGCPRQAAHALLAAGWIVDDEHLALAELFALLRKDELLACLPLTREQLRLRKSELLATLGETSSRPLREWTPELDEVVYSLTIDGLCDRLRLMFFGNLHQDWSEFVLAELGINRYENVVLDSASRALRSRADLELYLHLHACRDAFDSGEALDAVIERIGPTRSDNPYLAKRRDKLLLRIGQQLEREEQWDSALEVYAASAYPGARWRRIRVLERCQRHEQALALSQSAWDTPENDAERQLAERALARLRRQLGLPSAAKPRTPASERLELRLVRQAGLSVEQCVQMHLRTDEAPVFYVENTLICSLFGLLCWDAIFAPLPGAFFHPFHSGPVDLLSPDFAQRRSQAFTTCLGHLRSGSYQRVMRQAYADKFGTLSPFVYWSVLDPELLDIALQCLPAEHLLAWFQRLLDDIQANRAGMPDLIQFWPAERRYRMIEVKGPGDRLQDNQRRWLAFCAQHDMPVSVCHVQWHEARELA
ncbi:VRR-NUC domain-containing protein [Pseudomonas sp. LRF_L74]|uniref:VRR-NUC domain-containing protein n=1 Tax=Pseudomonas sp. LRF_L74 TaxID=3369422 RepID=UPI003F6205BB